MGFLFQCLIKGGAAVALAASFCLLAQRSPAGSPGTNQPSLAGVLVKNFVLSEHYEAAVASPGNTNRLKALVTGREATPESREVFRVQDMRMEHYQPDGRTNLVARSPECRVDAGRREVSSSRRVEAEGGGGSLYLEGEGFLCRLTNLHLIVSNKVRTVIRRGPSRTQIP